MSREREHHHPFNEQENSFQRHIYNTLNAPDNYYEKKGIDKVLKQYARSYMIDDERLPDFVEGLGLVIADTTALNQSVISDAVYIADYLKLWELAPIVKNLRTTELYKDGCTSNSQLKDRRLKAYVDSFLTHKRKEDLKERPYLDPPEPFASFILEELELDDFFTGEKD